MRAWRLGYTMAAVFGAVLLVGCGTPSGRAKGKVTFQNQPVAGAELVFQSEANPDERCFGVSDDGGAYHLSYGPRGGLAVGRHQVTIVRYTLPGGKPLPAGEAGDALKDDGKAVKQAFVFEKEIASGANTVDFDLAQGKKLPNPPED
jgi:hypothetical protein